MKLLSDVTPVVGTHSFNAIPICCTKFVSARPDLLIIWHPVRELYWLSFFLFEKTCWPKTKYKIYKGLVKFPEQRKKSSKSFHSSLYLLQQIAMPRTYIFFLGQGAPVSSTAIYPD